MYVYVLTTLSFFWYSSPPTGAVITDAVHSKGMFTKWSDVWLEDVDTYQKNGGMAVTDVDNDGNFDIIVAGFNGPNMVLKFDRSSGTFRNIATNDSPYDALRDEWGQTTSVAACDIDGDGREEIYMINVNREHDSLTSHPDKLFKWRNGKYNDLFADEINIKLGFQHFMSRSVACVDRYGIGKYGFIVSTYANNDQDMLKFVLIEMDEYSEYNDIEKGFIVLKDSSEESGLDKIATGMGIAVGPLLNTDGKSDIVVANEGNSLLKNGAHNFLFHNLGNGSFVNIAGQLGVSDENEAGRGVVLADFNDDGLFDIVCVNWNGPSRLYLQKNDQDGHRQFEDVSKAEFSDNYRVNSVVVADFNNDGQLEILFNNLGEDGHPQSNVLFTATSRGVAHHPFVRIIDIGDAEEIDGYGTGAVYVDVDDDGVLDLLLSHGQSQSQPVDIYRSLSGQANNYLRVSVLTKFGAPARGSSVKVLTKLGRSLHQVIDGGSGFSCQMEPVAHFGLGSDVPIKIIIQWTDGKQFVWLPSEKDINTTLLFYHPLYDMYHTVMNTTSTTLRTTYNNKTHTHREL